MPHLEELVEEVHESSSVSELDGGDVVYIARVPTKRIMTVTISVATHAGRRSLDSIVADLLSPLLATAERIERDLASARSTAAPTAAAPPARRQAT